MSARSSCLGTACHEVASYLYQHTITISVVVCPQTNLLLSTLSRSQCYSNYALFSREKLEVGQVFVIDHAILFRYRG